MLLAVIGWADTKGLLKLFGELVNVGIADFFGNLAGTHREIEEESLRDRHAFSDDIATDRCSKMLPKLMTEMAARHAGDLREIIQWRCMRKVFIEILANS